MTDKIKYAQQIARLVNKAGVMKRLPRETADVQAIIGLIVASLTVILILKSVYAKKLGRVIIAEMNSLILEAVMLRQISAASTKIPSSSMLQLVSHGPSGRLQLAR